MNTRWRPNLLNLAAKEFATSLYNDPAYRANFAKAFIARKVPSAIEIMVWHYACGKPKGHGRRDRNHERRRGEGEGDAGASFQ